MATLRFAPSARLELDDIWWHIAQDNPPAADNFIDRLRESCQRLAENPRMGKQREEWGRGLHSFPHGNFLILYRLLPDGIEVVRVIHGRRDIAALLGSENE